MGKARGKLYTLKHSSASSILAIWRGWISQKRKVALKTANCERSSQQTLNVPVTLAYGSGLVIFWETNNNFFVVFFFFFFSQTFLSFILITMREFWIQEFTSILFICAVLQRTSRTLVRFRCAPFTCHRHIYKWYVIRYVLRLVRREDTVFIQVQNFQDEVTLVQYQPKENFKHVLWTSSLCLLTRENQDSTMHSQPVSTFVTWPDESFPAHMIQATKRFTLPKLASHNDLVKLTDIV